MPLIDLRGPDRFRRLDSHFGETMGAFLSRLHGLAVERTSPLVPREESPITDWHADAERQFARVAGRIPASHLERVRAFLAATPPREQFAACLCHNDLGIEHVLVDPDRASIQGIIDWSDAAMTDPARDFGLIFRDLGDSTVDAVLSHYTKASEDLDLIRERAVFYARCSMLDDLEYGMRTGRSIYTDKSIAALSWLFPS